MSSIVTVKAEIKNVQENEGRGKPVRQYIFAIISNLGMFCIGLVSGWTSPIQPKLEDPEQTPLERPITPAEMSWVASLLLVSSLFGPFVATVTVDRFGRKLTLIVCCIPFIAGWLMIAFANMVALIFAARLLQGISMGITFTANVIYVSEIGTDEARGAITSMVHLFITLGILVMYAIGPFMSYHEVAYTMTSTCLLYFIMLWFIPESPNYHVLKGNNELAKQSLMVIRGKIESEVELELQKIQINLEAKMNETKAKITDLWLTKAHTMSVVIACILLITQQLSGQTVVLFYMVSIFSAAGSSIEPAIASIIVAAIQFFSSLFVPFAVERFGRKVLLIVSLSGVFVSLGVLGTYFKLLSINETSLEPFGWIPLVTLLIFIIFYCLGIGPIVWTIAGEIFPAKIKTLATSIMISLNSFMAFIIVLAFNYIQEDAGAHTAFWICCGAALLGLMFVCIFLPETKQKSSQEIEELLNR